MTPEERRAIEWECFHLINRYANLNDAQDWASLTALYAKNGFMTRPTAPDDSIVGQDAILASFEGRPARLSQHVCANIQIDVESATEAAGYSVILLFTGAPSEDGSLPAKTAGPLIGYFRDRFTLTSDGWRFSERHGGLTFDPKS